MNHGDLPCVLDLLHDAFNTSQIPVQGKDDADIRFETMAQSFVALHGCDHRICLNHLNKLVMFQIKSSVIPLITVNFPQKKAWPKKSNSPLL